MESATPGVKSTADGWLNRYLQSQHDEHATPFRAVALTAQLPRMLQGTAPALAVSQLRAVRHPRRTVERNRRRFVRSRVRGGGGPVLNGTGREAFNAIKMLKTADPSSYEPANGADYPRSPSGQSPRQIAQLTKSNVGLEVAFADVGGWDTHVNQAPRRASSRRARRFLARDRRAGHRPRRSHGRHRGVDDERVRRAVNENGSARHRTTGMATP